MVGACNARMIEICGVLPLLCQHASMLYLETGFKRKTPRLRRLGTLLPGVRPHNDTGTTAFPILCDNCISIEGSESQLRIRNGDFRHAIPGVYYECGGSQLTCVLHTWQVAAPGTRNMATLSGTMTKLSVSSRSLTCGLFHIAHDYDVVPSEKVLEEKFCGRWHVGRPRLRWEGFRRDFSLLLVDLTQVIDK